MTWDGCCGLMSSGAPLDGADRPRLPDIEQPEQRKADSIGDEIKRQREQGDPLADHFIDDDPAGIVIALVADGKMRGNPADVEEKVRGHEQRPVAGIGDDQPSKRQRDERAPGARRAGQEAAAEPARDQPRHA